MSDQIPTIAAYLNREFFETEDPFGKVRSLGFSAVEIPETYFDPPENPAEWDRLAESIGSGLRVCWHTLPRHNRHFSSDDEELRKADIERMIWEMDFAAKIRAESFVIHPGPSESAEGKQRVYEALGLVQEKGSAKGIQVLLENASGPFNGDPHELVAICENVSGLKLTFDCAHAWRSEFCLEGRGSLLDHLAIVRPYVHAFQFNDHDGSSGHAVGNGRIHWEGFLPMAFACGCDIWTVELHTVADTVFSRDFLEEWLQEAG